MNRHFFNICARLKQATTRLLLLVGLLTIAGGLRAADERNVLVVPDFEAGINKAVNVSINLENTQEVVAAQFDVELPFDVPEDGTPWISNRANQHSVTMNAMGDNRFTVVVMSMKNNALRGNAGLLLRLPMYTYDDGQTDKPYAITLTNVVLTDRQGNNICTETDPVVGYYRVSRAELPDLTVHSIVPQTAQADPEGQFKVDYTVENIGSAATKAGWTEKIYLKSALTGVSTYIGSQTYAGTLAGGNTRLDRSFTTTLPRLIHADGEQLVTVEIVPLPNTGEMTVDQANNNGTSEQTIALGKRLYLSLNKQNLIEGWLTRGSNNFSYSYRYRDNIALTVSRSGDWSNAEAFSVTCDIDGLLYMDNEGRLLRPDAANSVTVDLQQGAASKTVYLYAIDDAIVRSREAVVSVGPNHGYARQSVSITRSEDDQNPLTLVAEPSVQTEGEGQTVKLTLTRGGELTDSPSFRITCSEPLRFQETFPLTIVSNSPDSKAEAVLHLIDDGIPQLDKTVKFTAAATDYQTASASISLLDDDRPQVKLSLASAVVREDEGTVTATVTRTPVKGTMTVRLTSSSANVAFAASSVTFADGEMQKEVQVNIANNSVVDGQRSYNLYAQLSTVDGVVDLGDRAASQAVLTVADDESPYLLLTSNSTYVSEGSSFAVTVSRYTPSLNGAMTVRLKATNEADVELPAGNSVTIPSGSRSATFTVKVKRNEDATDNGRKLTLSASADGIADENNKSMEFTITDRTLPDAMPVAVTNASGQLYAGMPATFNVEIANVGTAMLYSGMQVELFLAGSSRLYSYTTTTTLLPLGRTGNDTAHGQTSAETFTVDLPAGLVGTYWLYVRVNNDADASRRIEEFSTSNNTLSTPLQVTIASPFKVTEFAADPDSYKAGEAVKARGKVESLVAESLNNLRVQVSMEGPGQSYQSVTCPIDPATGLFTTTDTEQGRRLIVSSSATGMLSLKARAVGQTDADKQASVNIWNLRLKASSTRWTLDDGYSQSGTITLTNNSGRSLSGLQLGCSKQNDEHFQLTMDQSPLAGRTLTPGEQVTLNYTVICTQPMTDGQYRNFTLTAEACDAANSASTEPVVSRTLDISYYCRPTTCQLVFENSLVNANVLLGSSRTLRLKVTNRGLRETGELLLSVPDQPWLKSNTAATMASIQPGKSAYVELELAHQPGMHSGETFTANVTLASEECAMAGVKLNMTITGIEYSKLNVDVEDIFVKALRKYTKVSAAQVSITNARTGQQVMTGLTDGNGHWMTDQITQGTYNVTVSALRHKSIRKQISIGPGEEQQMAFFLPYKAVLTNFVTELDAEGKYKMTSTIDIDKTAPQAIVVPTLPEEGFECGSQEFDIVLTNHGSFEATGVQLVFPTVENAKFTVGELPSSIGPGQDATVTVSYEGPEEGRRRTIAKLLMYYEFGIGGETYSEDDYYQSLVGCSTTNHAPIVDPTEPTPGGIDDDDDGGTTNEADPEGPSTDVALPTMNSSVVLTFDDITRVTTGMPFTAMLIIVNGQDKALTNVRFAHSVSDDSDDWETDMSQWFACEQASLQGFSHSGGQLSVNGQTEASMKLIFTPSDEAALDGSHVYYIGGKLSYTDTATGLASMIALPEVKIIVTLLGRISVTYLAQANFLGNDLSTGDTEERSVPGHFVAIVRNTGKAPVKGLTLTSNSPVVINNTTNERQHLEALAAVVGEEGSHESVSDFSIAALEGLSSVAGRWLFRSSEDSHHQQDTDFEATVKAQTESELEVTVGRLRKLFRAVSSEDVAETAYDMTDADVVNASMVRANVFLLDDEEDEVAAPDHVMMADGTEYSLQNVSNAVFVSEVSTHEYQLVVSGAQAGWAYGNVTDPGKGKMLLQRVERDGRVVSAANFWQTDHTVMNDFSAVSANTLHFADSLAEGDNVYKLTYVNIPGQKTTPFSIHLYAEDGTEIENGATTSQRAVRAEVAFTEEIKAMSSAHVSVLVDGRPLSGIKVSALEGDKSRWNINLSNTAEKPGLHILTLNCVRLKDKNNAYCEGNIEMEWTEQLNVNGHVELAVADESTGSIDKSSGDYSYGELTLTATPADGYEFGYWMEDGVKVEGAGATFTYLVEKASTQLTAVFVPVIYEISISYDEQQGVVTGMVGGLTTGYFKWHDVLTLEAKAKAGYMFVHWESDGVVVGTNETLLVEVEGSRDYTAVFSSKPTSIAAPAVGQSVSIYSIGGQLLRRNVTDVRAALRSMPEGLYIIGGRKVMNRKSSR